MRILMLKAVLCMAAALAALPAAAQESAGFQSPSGNIVCIIDDGFDTGGVPWVRCDMRDLTQSYTTPPADCDLDWGTSFYVEATGTGGLSCHGDTILSPDEPFLDYGQSVSLVGISCVSAKTGITCTNAEGGGFTLSRTRQTLF